MDIVPVSGVDVQYRNSLKEYDLSEFERLMLLEGQIDSIESEMQELEVELMTEELEQEEYEEESALLRLKRDKLVRSMLNIMVKRSHKKLIKSIKPAKAWLVKNSLRFDVTPYEVGIEVHIPGINNEYIKHLEKEFKTLKVGIHDQEIHTLKTRLKNLRTHKLICLPVKQAVFAVKIANDKTLSKLPDIPKAIKDKMEEENLTLPQFVAKLKNRFEDESIEEREEVVKLTKDLEAFRTKSELEMVGLIRHILGHLMLPIGEEYNYSVGQSRVKAMGKLKADKAMGLINFLNAVIESSKLITALSSLEKQMKTEDSLNKNDLLKLVRDFKRSMDGLQSLLTSYANT